MSETIDNDKTWRKPQKLKNCFKKILSFFKNMCNTYKVSGGIVLWEGRKLQPIALLVPEHGYFFHCCFIKWNHGVVRSSVSKLSEAFWWDMYLLCLSVLENCIPTIGDQKTHQQLFKFVSIRSLLWIWSWEVNLAAVWFWTGEEEGEMLPPLKKHCRQHGPSSEDLSFQTMRCTGTLWPFRQARCE